MKSLLIASLAIVLVACSGATPSNTGVYMLLDTSITCREELQKAEQIILLYPVATGRNRYVRRCAYRHRQFQRKGHRGQGVVR